MFNKLEFFGAIAATALIAFGIGYSKAREICLGALITVSSNNNDKENETEEES